MSISLSQVVRSASDAAAPTQPLRAAITLRFGPARLHGLVHWPPRDPGAQPPPLFVLLVDDDDPAASQALSTSLRAVVLQLRVAGETRAPLETALAALGWAAEHAADLAASPRRLAIAGLNAGGAHAAWLAVSVRDRAWPPVARQLLVHPAFSAGVPMPVDPAGVAPATIVSSGAPEADGARYAARLRDAGVEVEEMTAPCADATHRLRHEPFQPSNPRSAHTMSYPPLYELALERQRQLLNEAAPERLARQGRAGAAGTRRRDPRTPPSRHRKGVSK